MNKGKRLLSALLIAAMVLQGIFGTSGFAAEQEKKVFKSGNIDITVVKQSEWEDGYVAQVEVRNQGDTDLSQWNLQADLSNSQVENIWNAKLERTVSAKSGEKELLRISNESCNAVIAGGQYASFGFRAKGKFSDIVSMQLLERCMQEVNSAYQVTSKCIFKWGNHAQLEITLENQSDQNITDWMLCLDMPGKITNIWNAVIMSQENAQYSIKNNGNNAVIEPQKKVTFGCIVECDTEEGTDELKNEKLYSSVIKTDETSASATTGSGTQGTTESSTQEDRTEESTSVSPEEKRMKELEHTYPELVEKTKKDRDMIHTPETVTEEQSQEPVKVCILDSGIDEGNGINMVEQKDFLGLEINELFADFTGHGTAVAGVLAAKPKADREEVEDLFPEGDTEEEGQEETGDDEEEEGEAEYEENLDTDREEAEPYAVNCPVDDEIYNDIASELKDDVTEEDGSTEDIDDTDEDTSIPDTTQDEAEDAGATELPFEDAADLADYFVNGINPNVEIYSGRILDTNGQTTVERAVKGIEWAIEKKVDIISMSWGMAEPSKQLHDAIQKAADAGILLVAAAGNEEQIDYPARYSEVVAVGAVDNEGKLDTVHPSGAAMELVAPGCGVLSYGTFGTLDDYYGCSFSVPYVVGAASLLWEKGRSKKASDIRHILQQSAKPMGEKEDYGYGLLDVTAALNWKSQEKTDPKETEAGTQADEPMQEENEGRIHSSWLKQDHELMISGLKKGLKKYVLFGTLMPDYYGKFKGMVAHPGFHGYYTCKVSGKKEKANAIEAYFYLMEQAQSYEETGDCKEFSKMHIYDKDSADLELLDDQFRAGIKKAFSYHEKGFYENEQNHTSTLVVNSNKRKSYVVYGMALHCLADYYSHSSFAYGSVRVKVKKKKMSLQYVASWNLLKHGPKVKGEYFYSEADEKKVKKQRYLDAKQMIRKALIRLKNNNTDITPSIFDFAKMSEKNRKMIVTISKHFAMYVKDGSVDDGWKNDSEIDKALGKIYTLKNLKYNLEELMKRDEFVKETDIKTMPGYVSDSSVSSGDATSGDGVSGEGISGDATQVTLDQKRTGMQVMIDALQVMDNHRFATKIMNNVAITGVKINGIAEMNLRYKPTFVLYKKVNGGTKQKLKATGKKYKINLADENTTYYALVKVKKKKHTAQSHARSVRMAKTVGADQEYVFFKELQPETFLDEQGESVFQDGQIIPVNYQLNLEIDDFEQVQKSVLSGCVYHVPVDDDFITGINWYKDPLKGVTVTLTNRKTGKSYEQVSKADGCYQFEDIPTGDYVLHYEKDGYETADSYLSYSSKENTTCIPVSLLETEKKVKQAQVCTYIDLCDKDYYNELRKPFTTKVSIRKGINNRDGAVLKTITSGYSRPYYGLLDLGWMDSGYYTIHIESFELNKVTYKDKYVTLYTGKTVMGCQELDSMAVMSNTQPDEISFSLPSEYCEIMIRRTDDMEKEQAQEGITYRTSGANRRVVDIKKGTGYCYDIYLDLGDDVNRNLLHCADVNVYQDGEERRFYLPAVTGRYWKVASVDCRTNTVTPCNTFVDSIE